MHVAPTPEAQKAATLKENIIKDIPSAKEKPAKPTLEEIVSPGPEKAVRMKKCLKCKKANPVNFERCAACGHVFACVKK